MENLKRRNNKVKIENLITNTEFRRSLNHNYLILNNLIMDEIYDFSLQMIMENTIASLLPIEIKKENGTIELCYEISSLQSLSRIYEIKKISGKELVEIIRKIIEVFQRIKEYMLTEEEVVMLPEYIFMNPETREMKFLYCPYIQQSCENLFWKLSEFFLDHVEHQDSEAVVLAYQFYKIVRSDNYVLQEIKVLCERQINADHIYGDSSRDSKEIENRQQSDVGNAKSMRTLENIDLSKEIINKSTKEFSKNISKGLLNKIPKELSSKTELSKDLSNNLSENIPEKTSNDNTCAENRKNQIIIFLIITIISFILIIKNTNPINSYSKIISIGFLLFGLGGVVISLLKTKERKDKTKEINNNLTEKDFVNKPVIENEKDNLKYDLHYGKNVAYSEALDCGQTYDEEESHEKIYGKTEFCLITPEEEERVLVERKHGKEIRHKIDSLPFTIGKLKDMSNLYLPDNTVSRLHARIFEEDGKLYILDLGSTNGTYLNGISINQEEKFLLEAGDELKIGKTEFVYQ